MSTYLPSKPAQETCTDAIYHVRLKLPNDFCLPFQPPARLFISRKINFDDPADKERHDRLVMMVEKMLDLKQQHATASDTFNERRHELAADIQRLDSKIVSLVYELYNLTPAEISIIEGGA